MISRTRASSALASLVALGALSFSAQPAWAQDKSGTKEGLVKLPSAGGTVRAEGSTFVVQGNTGAANYSMPLPELPARAGVVPSVKLTYNQMNGDAASGFGSGWRLDISSIEVSSEFGIPYATPFATNDNVFRLNGQRLHADPTRPGQYRLQTTDEAIKVRYHESFFQVAWAKPVDNVVPSIPSGFEVVYPDGRVELYSGDIRVAEGAGALVTRFPLVYEVQRHGESIAYKYVKSANKSYLHEVAFASGLSRYSFDLMESAPNVGNYRQGFLQTNGRLVQRLVATYGGEVRNRWCFLYSGPTAGNGGIATAPECRAAAERERAELTGDAPVHDRLVSILRFGNTASPTTASLHDPAVHFEYSSWDARDLASRALVYPAPALQAPGIDATNFELLDANRDGLPDILKSLDNAPTQIFFGDAALARTFAKTSPFVLRRNGASIAPDLRHNAFQVADVNGDTFADIIEMTTGKIHVYGGGNEQTEAYQWRQTIDATDFDATTFEGGAAQFIDLNQDGLSDILTTSVDGTGRQQWSVYLNVTSGDAGNWSVAFARADFALPFPSTVDKMLRDFRAFKIVDVNGDGLPDFTWTNGPQGFVCVYENTGSFFQTPEPSTLLFGRGDLNDSVCGHGVKVPFAIPTLARTLDNWMIDVNGDGIKDFVTIGQTVRELSVWYGLGNLRYSDPVTLPLNTDVRPGDLSRSRVADIDGDGQEEIIVFQPLASGPESVVILDFNRTPDTQLIKSGLLTAVETEGGVRHDIRYATSTDEVARDQNQNLSPSALHFPVIVAKQVVRSSGKRGERWNDVDVTEYFYHGPYFDPASREFRGFRQVDQLVYGDEGATPEPTQETAYIEETFATYDPSPLKRQLSGRLLTRKVSSAQLDQALLLKIKDTNSFDPTNVLLHSLSTSTQAQGLVQGARLLQETQNAWTLVEQVPQSGAYFARLQETTTLEHGTSTSALKTTKTALTYDAHNVPTTERETSTWTGVPMSMALPTFEKVTTRDFTQSRRELSRFEAISLPSDETTTVNGSVTNRVRTSYDASVGMPSTTRGTIFQTAPSAELLQRAAAGDADLLARLEALAAGERETLSQVTYDVFGNAVARADALGTTEEVHYDAMGVLPTEHRKVNLEDRTLDHVTIMTYRPDGHLAGFTNPLGLKSTLAYDELGRRSALHYSDGGAETYQYRLAENDLPHLILTTSRRYASAAEVPAGESETIQTLKAYRSDGVELGNVENADDGGVRVLEYHKYNRKKNRVFTYTPYMATHLGGRSAISVQDLFDIGQIPAPEQADSPDKIGVNFRYDPLDRVSRQVSPSGKTLDIQHEPWGKLTTETFVVPGAADGARTMYQVVSPLGLLAKAETGSGQQVITRFDRDAAGHLTAIRLDGEFAPRQFRYDTSGKQEYQRIPGVRELYTLHDVRGRAAVRLTVSNDGQQINVTEVAYDSLDRPTMRWENGRLVQEQIYDRHPAGYRGDGELQPHVPQPLGLLTVSRSYDTNNLYDFEEQLGYNPRAVVVNRTVQLGQRTFTENFRYTLDGAARTIVTPRGLREDVSLNRANRLRRVTVNGASFESDEPVIEQVTYNPKNQIGSVAYRQGAKTSITYDPKTLLTRRIDSSFHDDGADRALQSLSYAIDGDLKITAIQDEIRDSVFGSVDRSAAFQYDWRGQLTSATRYQRTTKYNYDTTGGFTENDELPGTWRTSGETKLLPVGTDANAFSFDAFGQLRQSPEVEDARYDVEGRLVYVRTKAGQQITYGYNAQGIRHYKRVVGADGTAVESLYPVKTYVEEPSGAQSFVFVADKRLVRFDHGQGAGPDRWFYYLEDHIGSNDVLMSADGKPVEQILYFPYGSEAKASDLSSRWNSYLAANAASVPAEKAHHRFTGHYLDDETGLYYMGARYYHPKLGRFATPDPLFIAQPERCESDTLECNLYGYANNNPLTYVDPDGRKLELAKGVSPEYQKQYKAAIDHISKTKIGKDVIGKLQAHPDTITVRPPKNLTELNMGPFFDPNTNEIVWHPQVAHELEPGKVRTPANRFLHESGHALQWLVNPKQLEKDGNTEDTKFHNKEEKRVIETIETPYANEAKEPTRTDHGSGKNIAVKCSTCTK